MKCPVAGSPTAAELLEATKKLYVKTDALRQRRIEPGEPRLFQFSDPDYQTCHKVPCPSAVAVQIPSDRSAFTVVRKPLPLRFESDEVQQQSARSPVLLTTAPPLYPRSTSLVTKTKPSQQSTSDWKPTPKPRRSVMHSMFELPVEEIAKPQPKPRRKVLLNAKDRDELTVHRPISIEDLRNSPHLHKKKMITKSYSSLCAPSVAALKKRTHASRPPTPVTSNEEALLSFPVMDESERDFLEAAVRFTYSPDDEDSSISTPSDDKSCFLPSPTVDSGRPNSDDEDRRTHPCSTKSLDDGFFDSSLLRREEETASEALTSISNSQKDVGDYVTEKDNCGHNVSVLERNARIMRWVRGCQMSPP